MEGGIKCVYSPQKTQWLYFNPRFSFLKTEEERKKEKTNIWALLRQSFYFSGFSHVTVDNHKRAEERWKETPKQRNMPAIAVQF